MSSPGAPLRAATGLPPRGIVLLVAALTAIRLFVAGGAGLVDDEA